MLNLLAFDYGASSGRGILGSFDGNRLQLDEVHRFPNEPVQLHNSLYWDFLRLFHEMKKGINQCVINGNKNIASIGIDTWGVDFGLLDKEGRLLSNPLHYRDINTQGMIEEACKTVPKAEIYGSTGIQFQVFNSLYQLFSMKQKNPELLEKASTMLFMPDLLRYFLTGDKSTEYTIASTSQMLNAKSGNWDLELLNKLGIPTNILTEIVHAGTYSSSLTDSVAAELGIGKIPVIAVAEHDTASAVVSVPSGEGKSAYLSSGTWSLLGIEAEAPIINDEAYNMNYTNEGGMNKTIRFLKNIMGLWIYQECTRAWKKNGDTINYDDLEDEADKSEAFISLIDVDDPEFYLPGGMPEKIRKYCIKTGQKVPETKAQIVRCIMESLALKYRMSLEGLEKITGCRIPVLHIVGGGCKNVILSQYTANAINRPVTAGPIEATAVGNLVSQLIALGEVKDISQGRQIIRNSFPIIEYSPKETEKWNSAYERFLKLLNKYRHLQNE